MVIQSLSIVSCFLLGANRVISFYSALCFLVCQSWGMPFDNI